MSEVRKFAAAMEGLDFGTLTARNQLVKQCINPLFDMLECEFKRAHIVNSGTKYEVGIVITSTRDESVQ